MRYWISPLIALVLVISPMSATAQAGDEAALSLPPASWLRLELDLAGLEMAPTPEVTPLKLAQRSEAKPETVDPELSPAGVQRWHPEAFESAVESEPELEYVNSAPTTEQRRRFSKGGRIALAVAIPLIIGGVGVAIAGAVGMSNL